MDSGDLYVTVTITSCVWCVLCVILSLKLSDSGLWVTATFISNVTASVVEEP